MLLLWRGEDSRAQDVVLVFYDDIDRGAARDGAIPRDSLIGRKTSRSCLYSVRIGEHECSCRNSRSTGGRGNNARIIRGQAGLHKLR